MINIGIIAGGGNLPITIGKSLIKNNFNVFYFVIEEFYNNNQYKDFKVKKIKLNSAKKIIDNLKIKKINKIIMAGNINRPSLTDLSFDFQTLKIAKNLLLNKTGDNDLLVAVKNFFRDNGFEYLDWKKFCPELFETKDQLTSIKPSKLALKNLNKALEIFKNYGKLDIGQSIIIQNKIVVGLEALEGTDNLIIRCKNLKKSGDKGILVKLSKYNQNNILDIPTIGENTIKLLKENDYEGVYIEKGKCLILDKQKTVNLANELNIFICTCNKIE